MLACLVLLCHEVAAPSENRMLTEWLELEQRAPEVKLDVYDTVVLGDVTYLVRKFQRQAKWL